MRGFRKRPSEIVRQKSGSVRAREKQDKIFGFTNEQTETLDVNLEREREARREGKTFTAAVYRLK